jgi:predicted P-loop ATPase
MDIKDISAESVAKAVGGTIGRDGSILCRCPIHEASGTHNPSLVLSITKTKRILFHCRSQNCDAKHFHAIRDHLVQNCDLPRSHVGGIRTDEEIRYTYQHPDGTYSWTKTRYVTKSGKKRFRAEAWDVTAKQWSSGRPAGAVLLFNLATIATILAACPTTKLLIVEGEKDATTAGELGVLATTNADGAGKWRVEDTEMLIKLGVQEVVVCPDNDAPGFAHGIHVAKTFQPANVKVHWLELPGLGPKEDLSDWAPNQVHSDALLHELIETAPLFDADALDWRSHLKLARFNAGCSYRGDLPNIALALEHEPRLKGCFAWNDFRYRTEVIRKTPWCLPEWWETICLTPVGHRALRDGDIVELGNYLVRTYDFGACAPQSSRLAIHAEAERHIFDELKDWIDTRPDWDGAACLDGWLVTYAGADTEVHTPEYLALIGAKYVMQVLHRALNPGAKADYSLVFTAPQGFGKDRTLEAIFSPYYREGIPSPGRNPADFARGIAGAIVAHAAEMSAWRKSDVEEQKAALTRCVDTDRPAYGYEVRSYPRRTCLAFSTNDVEFMQDATGDRRYWPVSTIRDRIDIEGLRRNRDQILAEALHRLKSGEQYWPTLEEEERLIVPERQKFRPEAALEIIATLQRFIVEEPQTTRPNRGDFAWKWQRRPQPLSELYLDAFFEKCFGMYAAVRRQGLDRASKRDITYCTTWLRENNWRRVQKHLPDGQRVLVWRALNPPIDTSSRKTQASGLGSSLAEKPSPDQSLDDDGAGPVAGMAGHMTNMAGTAGNKVGRDAFQGRPNLTQGIPKNRPKNIPKQELSARKTQEDFSKSILKSKVLPLESDHFTFKITGRKSCLGLPSPDGLAPTTLDGLEERFPRDRFLALDMETTGLSATSDGVRTVQFADGESAAIMVFDHPVLARALVVLADFLRGRRVVAHNARFEASWLQQAGIDLVPDDTVLLFSAVRGTRSPKGDKRSSGGRVSLAALAAMVLNETLDKSEQVSDWAAPTLSTAQLTYALNDAIVTHRIWEALRAELHRKSKQHGVTSSPAMRTCASPPPWRTSWSVPASASMLLPIRRGSPASRGR